MEYLFGLSYELMLTALAAILAPSALVIVAIVKAYRNIKSEIFQVHTIVNSNNAELLLRSQILQDRVEKLIEEVVDQKGLVRKANEEVIRLQSILDQGSGDEDLI
jgi:hypothetical protein